jgi:hypothetical protein
MSLEGKLKDFGIADILQLLAQQQKTGMLLVERKTESAEIYFLNGLVIETRSSQHSDRLGEMLIRGGYITRQQVDAALAHQDDTFDFLGKILVRDGLLQHEVLQQALLTQTIETFFDILQWRDGHYKFHTEKFKKGGVLENIPGVQSILLDVLRMIDEWPQIRKIIPSFETVFELKEGHKPDDIEIDELPVYQLIDGRRSVQEIVDGSLLGRCAACKILAELLHDGIIIRAASRVIGAPEQYHSMIDTIFGPGAYVLLILTIFGAFFLPTEFPSSILPMVFRQNHMESSVDSYRVTIDQQRIRYALEAFYCQKAHYPMSLIALVNSGLLASDMIPEEVRYVKTQTYYTLAVGMQ